jgi:hypothetical protein
MCDSSSIFNIKCFTTSFHDFSSRSSSEYFRFQLSEQDDLIVWMRTAALPTFRKLYGRIETDIMENDQLTVVIQNNYNTYSFGGSKALFLSTTSWIGGKSNFIGIAYLTIGGLCIFLGAVFVILYMIKPRYIMIPLA